MASSARRPRLMSTDRFRASHRGTLKKILTTPVVLEVGDACARAGFAGENAPRAVLPAPSLPPAASPASQAAWARVLDPWARRLFHEVLLVNPRDRKVAVAENPSATWAFKEALVAALFRAGVPHVLFLPAQQLPPYAAGGAASTGLVVDVGHASTRVLPLVDGVPVDGALVEVPLGMRAVHERFAELAPEAAAAAPGRVPDLVARVCFARPLPQDAVLPDERVADEQRRNPHLPAHVWEPPALRPQPAPGAVRVRVSAAGDEAEVPGQARSHAADALFDASAASPTETSLGEAVLDALLRCPPDARAAAASGLLLVGGGAEVPGLAARLCDEMDNCAALPRYAPLRAFRRGVPFRRFPFPRTDAAWIGASVVASFALPERLFLARDDYLSGKAVVKDWARVRPRFSDLLDREGGDESY